MNSTNILSKQPEHGSRAVSNTETRLAQLWAELLKLDEVGIEEDYFALGGNSLLAVNLMARIEAQLGVRLPLTSIIEAPTVAQLARLVETRGSHSPLNLIREGGEGPPLFLVHDVHGETMLYRNLALHLDAKQAVYGLKPSSDPDHPILHTGIEEMAAFQIGTMRSVQPRGPYMLGGLCAGALIAFEMARQLQRAGEEVAMVALMDAADVDATKKPLRWATQRLTRLSATLEQSKGSSLPRRVMASATNVLRKARNFAVYLAQSRIQMLGDHTRMVLFRLYLKLGLPSPGFLRHIPVQTAYVFARERYRPTTAFDGELILIRATSGTVNDEPYTNRYVDPLLGWGPRATRGVRAFDVPGGHSSMLQEPNARVLAGFLQAYMDEVLKMPGLEVGRIATSDVAPPANPGGRQASSEPTSAAIPPAMTPSAVVGESPQVELASPSRPAQLLVVSASSREALESAAERLTQRLEELGDQNLPDVSYSLAVGHQAFEWRRAVVASNRLEAIERLRKGTGKGVWSSSERAFNRPVAFVLAGVGEQAGGAGRSLYEGEPAFRAAADHCAEILQPLIGLDIRESMFAAPKSAGNWLRGGGGVLTQTRVSQPSAFVLDWALAQMWMSWGVKPTAVLGYSVGEYAAAALAGVLRLEDALMLVARRAQWIEEMAEPGVMLAVPLTEDEVRPRLGDGLWVAAVNSPQATVIGGRPASIERLEEDLQKVEVVTRRVASDQGSHTPLLDPVRPHLKRLAEGVRREPPVIPMLSNVTGSWLSASEAQDANHWCEHMCGSLRFEQGIGELLRKDDQVVLEVGPGAGLSAMVRQHPRFVREMMARVLSSLPGAWDRVPEREHLAGVVGRLWVEGVDIDWEGYFAGENRQTVALAADAIVSASEAGRVTMAGERTSLGSPPDEAIANGAVLGQVSSVALGRTT